MRSAISRDAPPRNAVSAASCAIFRAAVRPVAAATPPGSKAEAILGKPSPAFSTANPRYSPGPWSFVTSRY